MSEQDLKQEAAYLRELEKTSNYFDARGPATAWRSKWGMWAGAIEELIAERERVRQMEEALNGYHSLMANLHSLTENPVGSEPWLAWHRGRTEYQKKAQAALRGDSTHPEAKLGER